MLLYFMSYLKLLHNLIVHCYTVAEFHPNDDCISVVGKVSSVYSLHATLLKHFWMKGNYINIKLLAVNAKGQNALWKCIRNSFCFGNVNIAFGRVNGLVCHVHQSPNPLGRKGYLYSKSYKYIDPISSHSRLPLPGLELDRVTSGQRPNTLFVAAILFSRT